jgi:hypothetical protein
LLILVHSKAKRNWNQRREQIFHEIDWYMQSERKTSTMSTKSDVLAAEVMAINEKVPSVSTYFPHKSNSIRATSADKGKFIYLFIYFFE